MARRPVKPARDRRGTVRVLPSGRYQAFYTADGQRITAPATFATEREGFDWLEAERVDRRRGAWLNPTIGAETLADYADRWLTDRDVSPRTREYYARTIARWILPPVPVASGRPVELGSFALHALTTAVIRTWHRQVLDAARVGALRRLTPRPRTIHPARAWAIAEGMTRPDGRPLGASGRMSPAILTAWEDAGRPTVAPSAPVLEDSHPDAGRTSAAQAYRVLRAILSTAVEDNLIPANPCRLKGAGNVTHPERAIASADDVDRLADLFPDRLRAAVILAAWSGLRAGEQFALARRHVDLGAGTVRVERALEQIPGQPMRLGKPKTRGSYRTINLPAFVVEELRRHLAIHVDAYPDALLFTSAHDRSRPVDSQERSRRMRRARMQLDPPRPDLTWHDLRHTSATLAYRIGASTREVMDRLGHTTPRAAQIYAHAADDADRRLADRLDELRRPAPVVPILLGDGPNRDEIPA